MTAASMKTYCVGGAVRDKLLGLEVKDRDYVVVGATVAQMLDLGYQQVGRDFPVFLHPKSRDEYALARTERKTRPGYLGFEVFASPEVTLEQDLARRDITINAMAQDSAGHLIDPHGGKADLKAKVLRHVSPAFAEDPVRVLRVARFAARFGFRVAAETMQLMRDMAARGEVDALVAERVWQEIARGLMERRPSRMFEVLADAHALERIAPEIAMMLADPARRTPVFRAVDYAASRDCSLALRFAALTHRINDGSPYESRLATLCERLRVPTECRELARLALAHSKTVNQKQPLPAEAMAQLLERCDAYRRPERFVELLKCCACIFHAAPGREKSAYPQAVRLQSALAAAASVDAGAIAEILPDPTSIRARIHQARVAAIAASLK